MIVLADPDRRFQARVADAVGRKDDFQVVDSVLLLDKVLHDKAGQISVVILGPNLGMEEALDVARRTQTGQQDVSVVLVANALTPDVLQQAIRAGVRDVLPAAFTGAQLIDTISRAESLSLQLRGRVGVTSPTGTDTDDVTDHKVITVFSSKGGCGKSFVSSNLAVALAQKSGEPVAMIDLDLQFGDLAIMLQLFPARTIYDAAQNLDRIDPEAMKGYLTPHRGQVFLLAAPLEPGLSETISAEAVAKIIRMMKRLYKYVIIDTPPSFTDHVLAALDESDESVLITSMDVPSIKNLKLSLQTLELLGFGRDRIRLILNRADAKVGLRVQEVEKTLGTRIDVPIPSSREVPLSINRGTPLILEDPKSPVVASIMRLVDIIGATAPAAPKVKQQGSGGLFRRKS
ncbi:MAG: AAA family ATPase [Actinomycetota bacterium]